MAQPANQTSPEMFCTSGHHCSVSDLKVTQEGKSTFCLVKPQVYNSDPIAKAVNDIFVHDKHRERPAKVAHFIDE